MKRGKGACQIFIEYGKASRACKGEPSASFGPRLQIDDGLRKRRNRARFAPLIGCGAFAQHPPCRKYVARRVFARKDDRPVYLAKGRQMLDFHALRMNL